MASASLQHHARRYFASTSVSASAASSSSSTTTKPTIGFIGVGVMGLPMSSNLARSAKGKYARLVLHDAVPSATEAWRVANTDIEATVVPSPAEVARVSDVIFTMLPTGAHVRSVFLDQKQGLLSAARPGALLVDSSTIEPETIGEIAEAAAKTGKARVIDAPVSGGVVGARAGTLTFMVGGTKDSMESARPWLQAMGKNLVHCGDKVGSGQVAKICNNMLLGTCMIATCEALHLARRNGMDPKLMSAILNTSSGRSWCSDTYNPAPGVLPNVPSSLDYEGGFNIRLMQKDMGLAIANAQKVLASVPLAASASQLYKHVMTVPGLERKDFSVIYAWLENAVNQYMTEAKNTNKN